VLEAATAMIDEVGIERFSVRALAERLGVFPAAIYWYLPTRNAILAAVVNHCVRDIDPRTDPADWKAWLRELFYCYRAVVRRHPRIAPLMNSQLLSNAGADLGLIERILAVLDRAGFEGETLLAAYDIVITTTVGFVTMEHASPPAENSEAWAEHMRGVIDGLDEAAYPTLARHRAALANRHFVLRWENGVTVPLEASFEAYVYTVIEGLRQLLTR